MYDNDWKILTSLEQKHFVKYLGVLIDSHLSWRYNKDYISSKIRKGVGIIARLRHLVSTSTILNIYGSLLFWTENSRHTFVRQVWCFASAYAVL